MAVVSPGTVLQAQFHSEIRNTIAKLGKEIAHVAYNIGEDSTGEPSLFFRIVLTDAAAQEDKLSDVTSRVTDLIFDELRPIENWGLHPYVNFRSLSEHLEHPDPNWAASNEKSRWPTTTIS